MVVKVKGSSIKDAVAGGWGKVHTGTPPLTRAQESPRVLSEGRF